MNENPQKISRFLANLYDKLLEASERPNDGPRFLQVFCIFEAALGALLVWIGAQKSCFPACDCRQTEVSDFMLLLNGISEDVPSVELLAFLVLQYRPSPSSSGSTPDCYMITCQSSEFTNEGRQSIDDTGKGMELEMFDTNISNFITTSMPIAFIIFETKTNAPLFVELSQLSQEEKNWKEFVRVCEDRVRLWNLALKPFYLPFMVAARRELKSEVRARL